MIRLATVFSGVGAIEHALDRMCLKHEIIFASDIDKYVKQSYFANYPILENQWHDDVYKIDGTKYRGKVDLFVGGSPCQSFSIAGKRAGLEDMRGTLVFEFIRLVREIQPKVFIYENVKGLLSHNKGETWRVIQEAFAELGYQLHTQVLNAVDYGVAQSRKRIFVVGFIDNVEFNFPQPVKLEKCLRDYLEKDVDDRYFISDKYKSFILNKDRLKKKYTQIDGGVALCQQARQFANWNGDFISSPVRLGHFNKGGQADRVYSVEGTSVSLSSQGGGRGEKTGLYSVEMPFNHSKSNNNYPSDKLGYWGKVDSQGSRLYSADGCVTALPSCTRGLENYNTEYGIRRLTPRECFRLMGFDDTFNIVVSDSQAYKQAGNSIVVDVLIAIISKINKGKK